MAVLSGYGFTGWSTEVFLGDAILPEYTPNVGGADVRLEAPLEKYLGTLKRLAEQNFARGWPGHRHSIGSPATRAREILNHHRKRAVRILDILRREEVLDPWRVSAHLFGELEGIHLIHGPGEAYAHLTHLESHGLVETTPTEYRLVAEKPALETIF